MVCRCTCDHWRFLSFFAGFLSFFARTSPPPIGQHLPVWWCLFLHEHRSRCDTERFLARNARSFTGPKGLAALPQPNEHASALRSEVRAEIGHTLGESLVTG